jgi:hypothetical protein
VIYGSEIGPPGIVLALLARGRAVRCGSTGGMASYGGGFLGGPVT